MLIPRPGKYTCSPTFFPLITLIFMLKAPVGLELIYMHGVRTDVLGFFFSPMFTQLIQHCLLERLSFLHWIILEPLSKINRQYMWGSISGSSACFHWSVCLAMCQHHITLSTLALEVTLKSNSINPPTWFLFKVILAILCPWHFRTELLLITCNSYALYKLSWTLN